LPVSVSTTCAGLLLLTEFSDQDGRPQRGNYFLRGFTRSWPLRLASGLFGLGVFRYSRLQLRRQEEALALSIPGQFAARILLHRPLPADAQLRMEHVFENNHKGIIRFGKRTRYVALEKTHWNMRGREVEIEESTLFDEFGARFEFAFDTSESRGHWHFPRRVPPPKEGDAPASHVRAGPGR
jgi:hypothetical protein